MALLSKAPPPPPPTKSLSERIEALHAEIDAAIDAKVEELRKEGNGMVHPGVIRQTITRGACPCTAIRYLEKMS